jgi:hypothetical protein
MMHVENIWSSYLMYTYHMDYISTPLLVFGNFYSGKMHLMNSIQLEKIQKKVSILRLEYHLHCYHRCVYKNIACESIRYNQPRYFGSKLEMMFCLFKNQDFLK